MRPSSMILSIDMENLIKFAWLNFKVTAESLKYIFVKKRRNILMPTQITENECQVIAKPINQIFFFSLKRNSKFK